VSIKAQFRALRAAEFRERPERLMGVRDVIERITCPCDYCQPPGNVFIEERPTGRFTLWSREAFIKAAVTEAMLREVERGLFQYLPREHQKTLDLGKPTYRWPITGIRTDIA